MAKVQLTREQRKVLKNLSRASAHKGNLANAGLVLDRGKILASSESLVVSNCDATAHSERLLVEQVCKSRRSNQTKGLTMVSIVEPCLMCLSACSQAGYTQLAYIIPAKRYVKQIPWMSDTMTVNKKRVAESFTQPIELVHLSQYEKEFSSIFEKSMRNLLSSPLST